MLVTMQQVTVYYWFELFPGAPVQGVTHLRVSSSLKLTTAVTADWITSEGKGPPAAPEGG